MPPVRKRRRPNSTKSTARLARPDPTPLAVRHVAIDLDGDICLTVGPERDCEILVSSKALSLASKVFKTMFSRQFKEGNKLAKSNKQFCPISLPDDDPDAMVHLCEIMHLRSEKLPLKEDRRGTHLKALALALDKYDCIDAARFATSTWMNIILNQEDLDIFVYANLMSVAYVIDDEVAFKKITRRLAMGWYEKGGVIELRKGYDPEGIVPTKVYAAMNAHRQLLEENCEFLLFKIINENLDPQNAPSQLQQGKKHICWQSSHNVTGWIRELNKLGLWPVKPHQWDLDLILDKLQDFHPKNIAHEFGGPGAQRCILCCCILESKAKLMKPMLEILNEGLCLDCFRPLPHDSSARQCRIHPDGAVHVEEEDTMTFPLWKQMVEELPGRLPTERTYFLVPEFSIGNL